MALGFIQPLTEISSKTNLSGSKAHTARETDNLIAMCEPIVYKMLDPQRLTNL
jgi:hypothetical protein